MRYTNLRNIGANERNALHILMEEEEVGLTESRYLAKIILLKDRCWIYSFRNKKDYQPSYDNKKENGYTVSMKKEYR